MRLLLLRTLRAVLPPVTAPPTVPQLATREVIIDKFYGNNYCNTVTISALSKLLHVSDRRTNQLIHQLYGCSFSEKLTDTRLEIAKLFLSYSDYSISQIAEASGFPSVNFFYKTFRKQTGASPGQYRKNQSGSFRSLICYKI